MLDFLGRSLNERRADFRAVEAQVLAADVLDRHQRRIDTYLRAAKRVLSEPLRVGIVGEVNAGKTELANLILGIQVLPSSVLNNTLSATLIRYGEVPHVRRHVDRTHFEEKDASELHRVVQQRGYCVECLLPLPLLKSIEIVDFPAFEAADLFSGGSAGLLSRSDLIVWCSSMSRAWTASEASAWRQMPERLRRSCLFALTHADKLADSAVAEVIARVGAELAPAGVKPISIAIPSAIEARSPRGQIMNRNLWNSSGGEHFLKELVALLQGSLTRRQRRVKDSASKFVLGLGSGASESGLSAEWGKLAAAFQKRPDRPYSDQDAAAALKAVERFKSGKLKPWLRARNRPSAEQDALISLLPPAPEALLARGATRPGISRQARIHEQILEELKIYANHVENMK